MIKIGKNAVMHAILFGLNLSSALCSGVYQKAMLDEDSQRYLSRTFVEPMKQSAQAEGVLFYPEEEFHISLMPASGPIDLKSALKCQDENAVENVFNYTNTNLKRTVSKTHNVLSDITFKVKGASVMGKSANRKFLVCEVEPVLDDCDKRKTAQVKACLEGTPHVSLARIDDAASQENKHRLRSLHRLAQDAIAVNQAEDAVTGRKKERFLKVNKVCAENGRNQTLMTSKSDNKEN